VHGFLLRPVVRWAWPLRVQRLQSKRCLNGCGDAADCAPSRPNWSGGNWKFPCLFVEVDPDSGLARLPARPSIIPARTPRPQRESDVETGVPKITVPNPFPRPETVPLSKPLALQPPAETVAPGGDSS